MLLNPALTSISYRLGCEQCFGGTGKFLWFAILFTNKLHINMGFRHNDLHDVIVVLEVVLKVLRES